MEEEIILGRDGNQPFTIKAEMNGVSRQHAKITIMDNGNWYLEDLDSSNGTFIRDEETGDFISVNKRIIITPMTFILLGPDNSKGCCFFAKQAVSFGDFTEDYEYLDSKANEFETEIAQIKKIEKTMNIVKTALPFAIFGLSLILIPGEGTMQMLIRMGSAAIPSVLIQLFYNTSSKEEAIKSKQDKFSHCPNPLCSNKMKTKDIHNLKCPKCKKIKNK